MKLDHASGVPSANNDGISRNDMLVIMNLICGVYLFALLMVGALAWKQWMNEGRFQVLHCVKVLAVDWEEARSKKVNGYYGYPTYRIEDGQIVRSSKALLFVNFPDYGSKKNDVSKSFIEAKCVKLWFSPGFESSPQFEQEQPPFTEAGGFGQKWLLAFVILLALRLYVARKNANG